MNKRPIISHFATFKRKNYLQTSGISPWLHKAVDKDLYYKLEETGPTLFVNQPLYYYRHHQNSISLNENSNIAYQYHLAIKASIVIRSLDRAHTLKQMPHTKSELTRGLMQTALYLCKKNNYSSSFELLVKALWYFPVHTLLLCLKSFYQKLLKPFFSKTKSILFRIVGKDNHKNDKLNLAKADENINVSDNGAMVNVLISTIDERINEISAILFEKQPYVRYIISHQYTDPKYKILPKLLNRDDVILSQIPGRGLSRSRNNALRLVESGIALISDDDIRYFPGSFEKIEKYSKKTLTSMWLVSKYKLMKENLNIKIIRMKVIS
jgi:hypothetical protein